MWIVCITSVRHVLTVNGYGGRQTKENEKSWCFKGWETLVTDIKEAIIEAYNKEIDEKFSDFVKEKYSLSAIFVQHLNIYKRL